LKRKYDELISKNPFIFKLRRYDAVECLKLLDAAGFDVVNHQSKVGWRALNVFERRCAESTTMVSISALEN